MTDYIAGLISKYGSIPQQAWPGATVAALAAMLAVMPAGPSLAQAVNDDLPEDPRDFSLFGSVNNGADSDEEDSARSRRSRNLALGNGEPEFVLVGTSRIGDRYSAILRHRDGNEVLVTTEAGRNARVEGYSQYTVVDVGPGRLSLQYPTGTSCVEFRNQGVTCNTASNIAALELTKGDPIPRAVVTARDEEAPEEGEVVVSEEPAEEPTNPFAALRARALRENGDAPVAPARGNRTFTPRRIDPADVPPGFRVVSTPFGDRLVRE